MQIGYFKRKVIVNLRNNTYVIVPGIDLDGKGDGRKKTKNNSKQHKKLRRSKIQKHFHAEYFYKVYIEQCGNTKTQIC